MHSLATQLAPATLQPVIKHFLATRRVSATLPTVFWPSTAIPTARSIRPPVIWRSSVTQPATTTRLTAPVHCIAIRLVLPTPRLVISRSTTTRPPIATSHWALTPVSNSPLAVTISILATQGSLQRPTPSASGELEFRQPHSSPGLAGQLFQQG